MDKFTEKLVKAGVVGIDTPVFIYHLEAHPRYATITQAALSSMEKGAWQGITSTITLMEITVRPWQLEREEIARRYETLLANFPNLTILDIDRNVAHLAAQLRARFNLPPPDALQVATSLVFGAKVFITNDTRLTRVRHLIEIVLLEDFVAL